MDFILYRRLKFYTKEFLKIFNIVIIALDFIITIVLIKYKPMYKVNIAGEEIGYVENTQELEEKVVSKIENNNNKNIDNITFNEQPEYELKLVDRTENTDEDSLINDFENNMTVTYKYYEVAIDNNTVEKLNTKEEAEEVVKNVKEKSKDENINLGITEKYTIDNEEIDTSNVEVAKQNVQENVENKIEEEKQKEEEEKLPNINGIKIAVTPIEGSITSRYGVSSRIRKSTHTGLDISATTGTNIKVVADGTVTNATYTGSYGNLVKIEHGNGVETWYGHTSKMYVKKGDTVKAGDVIAAVGSTGNSTGPHLHFEIRINGEHVNPQQYLYK